MSRIHDEAFAVLITAKDALDGNLAEQEASKRIFDTIKNEPNPSALLKEMTDKSKFPAAFPNVAIDNQQGVTLTLSDSDKDLLPRARFAADSTMKPCITINNTGFYSPTGIAVRGPVMDAAREATFDAAQTAKQFFDGKLDEREASTRLAGDLQRYHGPGADWNTPRYYGPRQQTMDLNLLRGFIRDMKAGSKNLPDFPIPREVQADGIANIVLSPGPADKDAVTSEPGSGKENRAVAMNLHSTIAAKFAPSSWTDTSPKNP